MLTSHMRTDGTLIKPTRPHLSNIFGSVHSKTLQISVQLVLHHYNAPSVTYQGNENVHVRMSRGASLISVSQAADADVTPSLSAKVDRLSLFAKVCVGPVRAFHCSRNRSFSRRVCCMVSVVSMHLSKGMPSAVASDGTATTLPVGAMFCRRTTYFECNGAPSRRTKSSA